MNAILVEPERLAPRPREYGATVVDEGVRFGVWAPRARDLAVRTLDARGRTIVEQPLVRDRAGSFTGTIAGLQAEAHYQFVLDGDRAFPDPRSRHQPHGVHGPSRVVDPLAFAWTDAGWRGLASMADYVMYELHVGTFTPDGTFDAIVPHLPELRALGVTAIELMPVAEFPGARNWGYDGAHLYAPQSTYGGPDGLRRLVDAAHAAGIAVVLDVVYNHLGPEGNYLDAFGPFFTDRYVTPWGRAVNYDGAGSDEVRRHMIDNACSWVSEYHVDALRLDAVHGIFDSSASHVLAELTTRVRTRAEQLGRQVHLIAESDQNDPRVVTPVRTGGWGFDAQWADDLHHALHSALTGERDGYYADFGGRAPVVAALAEPFVYDGRYSTVRDRRHGGSAKGLPRERFVVCSQNHDQVGNRAQGDRLSTLVSPARLRLAAALTLLSAYVPLLFMGEEYGETAPFLYFVSHGDEVLAESVRRGRVEEFRAFGWAGEIPDPQAATTFERSRLDREQRHAAGHAGLYRLYGDLLALRSRERALRPGVARVEANAGDVDGSILLRLEPPERERCRPLLVLFNLSETPIEVPPPERSGGWEIVLHTEDTCYGGEGGAPVGARAGPSVSLGPHSAALLG